MTTSTDELTTGPFKVWDDIAHHLAPIDSAKPHPKNARRGRLDIIEQSMREHGLYEAFLVQQSTGYIVFGAHRWKVLKDKGATGAPLRFADLTDEQAERIRLVDNRAAELGDVDLPTLVEVLQGLGDLRGTGYDDIDLSDFVTDLDLGGDVGPVPEDVEQKEHKKKFNTDVEDADDMRIDKSRRILVLDCPVQQYAWLIEGLAEVAERHGLDNNTEAVIALVAAELDIEAPASPGAEEAGADELPGEDVEDDD